MNEMINLTPVINAVLLLISACITAFLIPWIKANTTAKQREELRAACKVAVYAAEQLFGAKRGEEKLQYALQYIESKGYTANLDEARTIIESFVFELQES